MKIAGQILDERDHPVPNASVEILVAETRLARVTSGDDGSFEFSSSGPLDGHAITLAVAKEGYRSMRVSKDAKAEDLEQWRVILQASVSPAPSPRPSPLRLKWLLIPVGLAFVGLMIWLFWPRPGPHGPKVSFEANPGSIKSGETALLAWKVSDAETVEISPDIGPVSLSGRREVKPGATMTYTLSARNGAGETTREAKVEVQAGPTKPEVISFTANPLTIQNGSRSTLSWRVSGAESVEISPGIGSVQPSGQKIVTPSRTTPYTLLAKNAAGETRDRVTIRVTPAEQLVSRAIFIGPDRASVVSGDTEMDSDDWTWTRISYSIAGQGTRNPSINVTYEAREGNSDKSFGNSYFRSSQTFPLGPFNKSISEFSVPIRGNLVHWHGRGRRHGWQRFPNFGPLEGVQVSFDSQGRKDLNEFQMKANLKVTVQFE